MSGLYQENLCLKTCCLVDRPLHGVDVDSWGGMAARPRLWDEVKTVSNMTLALRDMLRLLIGPLPKDAVRLICRCQAHSWCHFCQPIAEI